MMQQEPTFCEGTRIYNRDKISPKTVLYKPQPQVEGKEFFTAGNSLPPVMVFPRKKVTDVMFEKAPCGTPALSE
ncbi:hypothetical protein PR048_001997 [Dryococelus australis]|uniref:Uncharacterized protein n=1 Tax=Dryococelus australis TaxID=614101 RepID=A0ABQ9IIX8_9NEOP|nr:hypothetical protein PR048_001997 [Dryococelus australis]